MGSRHTLYRRRFDFPSDPFVGARYPQALSAEIGTDIRLIHRDQPEPPLYMDRGN